MSDDLSDPRDEEHFAAVVEEYGHVLRRAILRFCPRDLGLQRDDLEQEARLRLWTALRRERPIGNLASYIYRVAASATIDAIRRLKARREQQLDAAAADEPGALPPAPAEEGEKALERKRLLEKVEAVLGGLEPRRVQVVRLHLQGFTTIEMARLLGTTEPSARNLLSRALKELRGRLEEEGITYAGE